MLIIANIQLDEQHFRDGLVRNADVYINLYDLLTGERIDGNNIEVTYQIDEFSDGVLNSSLHTINVPGQTMQIGFNEPVYEAENDGIGNRVVIFYRNYFVVGVSAMPDPAPPVTACNLYITGINVDKLETAPGATDAQITVNAYSSFLPVKYSLDNVNFQTSNVFTGLTGGLKTIYVTDANTLGCTANQNVIIPTVSSLLIKDPSVTVGGNVSRWNAAFNPIVFTYQRKDFEIFDVSYDSLSGYARLIVNISETSQLTEGDKVYVDAGNYKGVYDVFKADNQYLVIKTPYTTTASGFININKIRSYYAIKTRVSYIDPATGQQKTIESVNRPDSTGVVKADISNFLQSLVRPKDDSNFTATNFRDSNLSASYRIAYAQEYEHNGAVVSTPFTEIDETWFVVYAAKQLGQRYGGNLAAHVPFKTVSSGTAKAAWICDFAEPAYSNGYPFDIGFIYSEDLLGLNLYCELTLLDINRKPLAGGTEAVALLNEDNSWLLNQDSSKYIIVGQTTSLNPLSEQIGLNRLLINSSFPSDAYYFTIALKYDDENDVSHTVTQIQTVRIDDAIDTNSVYLRWIGLSGSWNYYRFVYNQEISLDVQNATIIKNYVTDWENQQGIEEVISKSAGQKMKVMAEDLSINDIKGLQSIKYSPKVQMLVNKNPAKWQTIVLNTASFAEYETRNGQAPFSVTFNLPSINIQSQ